MHEQDKRGPVRPDGGAAEADLPDPIRTLEQILAPHIGAHMARASVRGHCRQLGIEEGGRTGPAEIESLIGRLSLGLAVLVGRERSEEVSREMRGAVAPGGRA